MSFADKLTLGGTDGVPSRARRLLGMSVGLIYLSFPVMEVLAERKGAEAFWGGVSIVAFMTAYVATTLSPRDFTTTDRRTIVLLGLTSTMAIAFAFVFGGGWLTMPIYTVVLFGFTLPPKRALVGIGVMLAVVIVAGTVNGVDPGSVGVLGLQAVTLGVLFISVRNTRLLAHRLQQAQGEVARLAAAEERLRIARDLHDLLGHSLSLIVLKSELAGRLAEDGSRVRGELADIESVARKALVEVREAVTGYRQRSLTEELDNARAVLRAAGVESKVLVSGTPLPGPLDALLGWAAREGVTNVVRHAAASRCRIEVTVDAGDAILEIMDDGRGEPPEPAHGSGLNGLRERVEALGGVLSAGGAPGAAGFLLRVSVPVVAA